METFNYVQFENMFFNVKSLWFFGLFYSVKNRHPFFSILILSSLSLHLWFFMSTTWQNITFPSRKMLLSSWVFEVTHIRSEIEGGGCWLPPFLGNSNRFPLFFHLYPFFNFHPHFIFIEVIWLSEIVASIIFTTCLLVFKVIRLNLFKSKFYQINEVARSIINWWDNWYAKEQDRQALVIVRSKNLKILRWWQA